MVVIIRVSVRYKAGPTEKPAHGFPCPAAGTHFAFFNPALLAEIYFSGIVVKRYPAVFTV
jgi:hypothetical protein